MHYLQILFQLLFISLLSLLASITQQLEHWVHRVNLRLHWRNDPMAIVCQVLQDGVVVERSCPSTAQHIVTVRT
jgi:hypothetical protein